MSLPESVLEHTGFVAMTCMFIADGLLAEGYNVDKGRLLSKALAHDFDEVVTGDIAKPIKYHSPALREMIAEVETENMQKITSDIGYRTLFHTWYKSKDDPTGQIVALADTLSAVYKFHDEICRRGNLTMVKFMNDGIAHAVRAKFIAVMDCYQNSSFLQNAEAEVSGITNILLRRKNENRHL